MYRFTIIDDISCSVQITPKYHFYITSTSLLYTSNDVKVWLNLLFMVTHHDYHSDNVGHNGTIK